jgi:hypothetical protein
MKKIFYNYYRPFRNLFSNEKEIQKFSKWTEFHENWETSEKTIIILPVITFDLIGLDVRFVFRKFGRNNNVKFLLIGTSEQIEYSLTQNEAFLGNIMDHLVLPHDFDTIEFALLRKIAKLEKMGKGRKI